MPDDLKWREMMKMNEGTHHIGITEEFAEGTSVWLVSGEPARTKAVYSMVDVQKEMVSTGRELYIAKGILKRNIGDAEHRIEHHIPVGLATSGMGMSSSEIVMSELIETVVRANPGRPVTFIRTGTCGSHQRHVYGGDVVIAKETYAPFGTLSDIIATTHDTVEYHERMSTLLYEERKLLEDINRLNDEDKGALQRSFSNFYENNLLLRLYEVRQQLACHEIVSAPACDPSVIESILKAARNLEMEDYHIGPVFSKQTLSSESNETFLFRPGGIRAQRLQDRKKVLEKMDVLASEMEIAMMTSIAQRVNSQGYDVRVGGIMAVVNNPRDPEKSANPLFAEREVLDEAVKKVLKLGLETVVEIYIYNNKYKSSTQI